MKSEGIRADRARATLRRYSHPRRALPMRLDAELYEWRHLIENFFCKLREFKRIAMRADKTDQSFAAIIHLVARQQNEANQIPERIGQREYFVDMPPLSGRSPGSASPFAP